MSVSPFVKRLVVVVVLLLPWATAGPSAAQTSVPPVATSVPSATTPRTAPPTSAAPGTTVPGTTRPRTTLPRRRTGTTVPTTTIPPSTTTTFVIPGVVGGPPSSTSTTLAPVDAESGEMPGWTALLFWSGVGGGVAVMAATAIVTRRRPAAGR